MVYDADAKHSFCKKYNKFRWEFYNLPVSHKKTYVWGDWFTNYKMVHEPKSISQ
jgi:hypothetical protein